MIRNLFIISVILCLQFVSYSQEEWKRILFDDDNYMATDVQEYYDKGYLINGLYSSSIPDSCWLYKTDINGFHLWTLNYSHIDYVINVGNIVTNTTGDIFSCGATSKYSTFQDPFIMKQDACGHKQWSWVYRTFQNYDYCKKVLPTSDGGVFGLMMYTDPHPDTNRICVVRLDNNGNPIWINHINGIDTLVHNDDVSEFLVTENEEIIIAGECTYEEIVHPFNWWYQPYYLKLDNSGNFIWESTPLINEPERGGRSNDIINGQNGTFYSSIKQFYHAFENLKPSMIKFDNEGELIDVYDIIQTPHVFGYFGKIEWLNDSLIVGNADWTNDEEHFATKAIIIDTIGNILHQRELMDTEYYANLDVTLDQKIIYLVNNKEDDNMFDIYLFKFNQELEYDSIYTQSFEYDYLCDHPINEHSIDLEGCGFWLADNTSNESLNQKLMITPNPATDYIHIQLPEYVTTTYQGTQFNSTNYNYQYHKDAIIQLVNINGQIVYQASLSTNQNELRVDVNDFSSGLYVVSLIVNGKVYGFGKVVIR